MRTTEFRSQKGEGIAQDYITGEELRKQLLYIVDTNSRLVTTNAKNISFAWTCRENTNQRYLS
tara:strand:+ start:359 stop:547 length:189 start_codon:yes stop_codon:yes gene_type:complete